MFVLPLSILNILNPYSVASLSGSTLYFRSDPPITAGGMKQSSQTAGGHGHAQGNRGSFISSFSQQQKVELSMASVDGRLV